MKKAVAEHINFHTAPLHDHEFEQFRGLIHRIAGISLSPAKKSLICSRLGKRLHHYQISSYSQYYRLLTHPQHRDELEVAINLITTNETHFFREPKHFEYLRQHILPIHPRHRAMRIWSAACSSGEEPYTIAMLLDEAFGMMAWEVMGSDLSTTMLNKAKRGLYPRDRIPEIPQPYLSQYCLKGQGNREGTMLIQKNLRDRVRFFMHNLTAPAPQLGELDAIFLRNVMIYFDQPTKQKVVSALLPLLRPGGYFFVSHSETLGDIETTLNQVAPSIYRKNGRVS